MYYSPMSWVTDGVRYTSDWHEILQNFRKLLLSRGIDLKEGQRLIYTPDDEGDSIISDKDIQSIFGDRRTKHCLVRDHLDFVSLTDVLDYSYESMVFAKVSVSDSWNRVEKCWCSYMQTYRADPLRWAKKDLLSQRLFPTLELVGVKCGEEDNWVDYPINKKNIHILKLLLCGYLYNQDFCNREWESKSDDLKSTWNADFRDLSDAPVGRIYHFKRSSFCSCYSVYLPKSNMYMCLTWDEAGNKKYDNPDLLSFIKEYPVPVERVYFHEYSTCKILRYNKKTKIAVVM